MIAKSKRSKKIYEKWQSSRYIFLFKYNRAFSLRLAPESIELPCLRTSKYTGDNWVINKIFGDPFDRSS